MLTVSMILSLWCAAGAAPGKTSAGCQQVPPHQIEMQRVRARRQWRLGNYQEAVNQYRQVLELERSAYGPANMLFEDLHNMAVLSSDAGLEDDAETYYEAELKALQRHGQGAEAGAVYVDLGEQEQLAGRFSKAEAEYTRALAAFQGSTHAADSRKVTALDDLGWLYITWGRLNDGARLLDRAQAQAEQDTRISPPILIRHLDTQAAYRLLLGQYTEAERLWQRALKIGNDYYGSQAHEYDNLLVHFGQACVRMGDYGAAQEMFERYLRIESRSSRLPREQNAIVLGELAHLFTIQHKYSEAEPLLKQSLAMIQQLTGKAPLSRSLLFTYYGDYFMAQNKFDDAAQDYEQALGLQRQVLGDTRVAASSMELLSKALRKMRRKREAKEWMAEARKIQTRQPDLLAAQDIVDVRSLRAH
jgi:tetratricopeptide (TPR) repeat protein